MSKVIEITENQYNAFVNGFDLIENKSIIDEAIKQNFITFHEIK